ncbi:MAG: DUF366 family protein [Actinomycetia bacterium]|nr:DUF366 family protein [Actinomycetes bacterium]
MRIKTLFYDKNSIDYDGSQLRSGWIKEELNISGNAAVSFRGKCNVKKEFMVDLEDLRNNETIFSNDMLHFLIKIDERDLEKTVLRQRIVISIIKETIEMLNENLRIRREGDDLFIFKKSEKN